MVDGRCVMNVRQMAAPMKQVIKDAKNFVEEKGLDTVSIRVPSGRIVTAYPLTTVASYWEYLLKNSLLPKLVIKKKYNWNSLIDSLRGKSQTEAVENGEKENQQLKSLELTLAKPVVLRLQKGIFLEVLVLEEGEYRISFEAGLDVVKLSTQWLLTLPNSPNRLKSLEKKGFSGASKQCSLDKESKLQIVETLSMRDWLIVWEHLASRSNSRAASVLRACAEQTIAQRIEAVFPKTA